MALTGGLALGWLAQEWADYVSKAEAIFIGGGNQAEYIYLWRGKKVGDALVQKARTWNQATGCAGCHAHGFAWACLVCMNVLAMPHEHGHSSQWTCHPPNETYKVTATQGVLTSDAADRKMYGTGQER